MAANNDKIFSSDPQGQIALMLCESLLHVLVEAEVLSHEQAMDAIETVAELTREIAEGSAAAASRRDRARAQTAVALVAAIKRSLAAKTRGPLPDKARSR